VALQVRRSVSAGGYGGAPHVETLRRPKYAACD
jgi:hypothetical protein